MPRLRPNTSVVIGAVIAIIAASLVVGFILDQSERDANGASSQAADYLLTLRTATTLMVDMETGMRGFVISGNETFLEPYNAALPKLPALWQDLESKAQVIDAQAAKPGDLLPLVKDMENEARTWQTQIAEVNIAQRRSGNFQAAFNSVSSGRGKLQFDKFRATEARVEGHVNAQTDQYSRDLQRISNIREGLILGLGLISLGSALFAWRVAKRDKLLQEEAVRAAEAERERLRTLFEYMPVAVRLFSPPDADIILQNSAAEEVFPTDKWNSLEPQERPAYFGVVRRDGTVLPYDKWPALRSLREGVTITNFQYGVSNQAGGSRSYLISSAPLKDRNGKVISAVAVLQDVTRMKELEQRKDEFIATAAHELRNPVTAMSGYYQLFNRQIARSDVTLPPGTARYLDGIGYQINRINTLVEHLLDASRIELGRLVLNKTEVDLVGVARTIASDLETASEGSHTVRVVGCEEGVTATCDEIRIAQVITNLVSNAVRYSPAGTDVQINVERRNGEVRVEVIDQGPGVPAEQRASLFERYYQILPTGEGNHTPEVRVTNGEGNRKGRGLGLGLYISSEIVKAHKGQIGMEPNPSGGSIFWFTIPA